MADFSLTDASDNLVGTSENDLFVVANTSGMSRFAATDVINGGAGIDTLQLLSPKPPTLVAERFSGLSSVEVIDISATASGNTAELRLNAAMVGQADDHRLTVSYGAASVRLSTHEAARFGTVIVNGTGHLRLFEEDGQAVTIADGVNGDVEGGEGDDNIFGGSGNDIIASDGGHDYILGGAGNDTINAGNGFDLIAGGAGVNLVTGGAGSDTFVISDGETLTITDFAVTDALELIDLRAVGGVTDFSSLSFAKSGSDAVISAGSARITLKGVDPAALTAANFVLPGSAFETLAQIISADPWFSLTGGTDNAVGSAGSDVFSIAESMSQFTMDDTIDGGAGYDTLRVTVTNASLASVLDRLNSIERIDLSGSTGKLTVFLDKQSVDQADNDTLRIRFGANDLALDTKDVGGFGRVVLAGTGEVQLENHGAQNVWIADTFEGHVTGANWFDTITGGTSNDVISGGEQNDTLAGGGGDDLLSGDDHDDVLAGGDGNDTLRGGEDNDTLDGGQGDDLLEGGAGLDAISFGLGADTVTGGAGGDTFTLTATGGTTTFTDFEHGNPIERIDLRATGVASYSSLKIIDTSAGVEIKAGTSTLILEDVKKADLSADDFVLKGQDPLVYTVKAGASLDYMQELMDGAPKGAIIKLAAGDYYWGDTLDVRRGDISLIGAGSDKTIIHTTIPKTSNAPGIVFQTSEGPVNVGKLTGDTAKGATQITLDKIGEIKVGDVIYVGQLNDKTFLEATDNTKVNWDTVNPERQALREMMVEVTAISGNTLTLSHPLEYAFEKGKAFVQSLNLLENVTVSGFTVTTDGKAASPTDFTNPNPVWNGTATIEFDAVRNSKISDIKVLQAHSVPLKFQRVFEVVGDNLYVDGAHSKDSGQGYGLYLSEAFANTFTNVTLINTRHGLITSSFSAEHYNYVQIKYTNRDINFHGSPDSDNTVVVDKMVLEYGNSSDEGGTQWGTISGGVYPIHPRSTVDANNVTFKYVVGAGRDDKVKAAASGGYLDGGGRNDTLTGQGGNDTLIGGQGDDTITTGGGRDKIIRRASDDGVDTVTDFKVGKTGDIIIVQGFAITKFSEIRLVQKGADTLVDFGNFGSVLLKNVKATSLKPENFRFEKVAADDKTAQTVTVKDPPSVAIGTDGADILKVTKAALDGKVAIYGGAGYDVLTIGAGTLATNSANWGKVSSIEAVDISGIKGAINFTLDSKLVAQSPTNPFVIKVGALASLIKLDIGDPAGTKQVDIEGSRKIQLADTRGHDVHVSDKYGAVILGGKLNDTLDGGAKNDSFTGGAGNDKLTGNAGNDTLVGNTGDDTLDGGAGKDTLTGSQGKDTFLFTAATHTTVKSPDRITDFSVADKDRIDLHLIDANTKVKGIQDFKFIDEAAFTKHAGELRAVINGSITSIQGDTNGDGKADFQIDLTGKIDLHATDFIF